MCKNCNRNAANHKALFDLLTDQQRVDVQISLCAGHEGGDCPGDPFQD